VKWQFTAAVAKEMPWHFLMYFQMVMKICGGGGAKWRLIFKRNPVANGLGQI
jgi:hypothetical protein